MSLVSLILYLLSAILPADSVDFDQVYSVLNDTSLSQIVVDENSLGGVGAAPLTEYTDNAILSAVQNIERHLTSDSFGGGTSIHTLIHNIASLLGTGSSGYTFSYYLERISNALSSFTVSDSLYTKLTSIHSSILDVGKNVSVWLGYSGSGSDNLSNSIHSILTHQNDLFSALGFSRSSTLASALSTVNSRLQSLVTASGSLATEKTLSAISSSVSKAASESTLSAISGKVATEGTLASVYSAVSRAASETTLSAISGKVATEATLLRLFGSFSTDYVYRVRQFNSDSTSFSNVTFRDYMNRLYGSFIGLATSPILQSDGTYDHAGYNYSMANLLSLSASGLAHVMMPYVYDGDAAYPRASYTLLTQDDAGQLVSSNKTSSSLGQLVADLGTQLQQDTASLRHTLSGDVQSSLSGISEKVATEKTLSSMSSLLMPYLSGGTPSVSYTLFSQNDAGAPVPSDETASSLGQLVADLGSQLQQDTSFIRHSLSLSEDVGVKDDALPNTNAAVDSFVKEDGSAAPSVDQIGDAAGLSSSVTGVLDTGVSSSEGLQYTFSADGWEFFSQTTQDNLNPSASSASFYGGDPALGGSEYDGEDDGFIHFYDPNALAEFLGRDLEEDS